MQDSLGRKRFLPSLRTLLSLPTKESIRVRSPVVRRYRLLMKGGRYTAMLGVAIVAGLVVLFAGRVAAPWINAGHENERGNRARFIAFIRIEAIILMLNMFMGIQLLAYYTAWKCTLRGPNISLADKRKGIERSIYLLIPLFTCSHLVYAFYYLQNWTPWWLWELTGFIAGFWTNLLGFVCGFFIVNWTVYFIQQWYPSHRALIYFTRWPWLKQLVFVRQAQIRASLWIVSVMSLVMYFSADKIFIRDATFRIRGLSTELGRPISLALVTDVHAGASVYQGQVEKIVNAVLEMNVDALVIVGDMVDGEVDEVFDRVAPLLSVPSTIPVYFVTGNHDYYYGDVRKWIDLYKSKNITVLQNEHSMLKGICLAGVNDISSGKSGIPNHKMNATQALSGCPQDATKVLLAHNPASVNEFTRDVLNSVDLVLSGHTHAGQFYVIAPVVYWFMPYFYGVYDVGDHAHLFVTAGTLYQGPPMKMVGASQIWKVKLVSG